MLDKEFLEIAEETYGLVPAEHTYTEVIAQALLAQAQALTIIAKAQERQAAALEKLAGCVSDNGKYLDVISYGALGD